MTEMDGDRNESAELAHDSYFVSGSLSVRGAVQSAWPGRGGSHRTSLSVTDSRYGLLRPDAGHISTPGCTNVNRLHRNPARINRLCGKTPPTGQLCCLLTGARSIAIQLAAGQNLFSFASLFVGGSCIRLLDFSGLDRPSVYSRVDN